MATVNLMKTICIIESLDLNQFILCVAIFIVTIENIYEMRQNEESVKESQ